MLREEIEQVKQIAREIAREEIAAAKAPKAKIPEPAPEKAKAEVPHKNGK